MKIKLFYNKYLRLKSKNAFKLLKNSLCLFRIFAAYKKKEVKETTSNTGFKLTSQHI